ncbi:hypothetical protein FXO37_01862 [Capsicum annuum]|nr:hypothetical protein FXO37_01862 [Capsicum annuum]
MLSGYAKNRRFCDAVDVFEAMPEKNVVSYNAMLSGYLGIRDFMSARKMFDEMGERHVVSWNAMINGYVKVGRMREVCDLFDEMPTRNEVSYTIMILGCVKVSEFEEAWRWFVDMRRRGVMSDQKTFLVVLLVVIGLDNVVTLANLVTLAMKVGYRNWDFECIHAKDEDSVHALAKDTTTSRFNNNYFIVSYQCPSFLKRRLKLTAGDRKLYFVGHVELDDDGDLFYPMEIKVYDIPNLDGQHPKVESSHVVPTGLLH